MTARYYSVTGITGSAKDTVNRWERYVETIRGVMHRPGPDMDRMMRQTWSEYAIDRLVALRLGTARLKFSAVATILNAEADAQADIYCRLFLDLSLFSGPKAI